MKKGKKKGSNSFKKKNSSLFIIFFLAVSIITAVLWVAYGSNQRLTTGSQAQTYPTGWPWPPINPLPACVAQAHWEILNAPGPGRSFCRGSSWVTDFSFKCKNGIRVSELNTPGSKYICEEDYDRSGSKVIICQLRDPSGRGWFCPLKDFVKIASRICGCSFMPTQIPPGIDPPIGTPQ